MNCTNVKLTIRQTSTIVCFVKLTLVELVITLNIFVVFLVFLSEYFCVGHV